MPEVNVVALFKGNHRYVYVYDDKSQAELASAIRDTAADPAATLNWFDAAVLLERMTEQATHAAHRPTTPATPARF